VRFELEPIALVAMEVTAMGLLDDAKNRAEELLGKGKQKVGEHNDDKSLQAEGKVDEAKADLKQAGEDVKDKLN
jgi:uncharacterized protein YjbJ (UPF0337 family)